MTKNRPLFAISDRLSSIEIKNIRKKLNLTQQEFSSLVNASTKTIEKWESSTDLIKGPIVTLIKMLNENPEFVMNYRIFPMKHRLRIWYMFRNEVCTIIDVDEKNRKVTIRNYTGDLIYRAFGNNENPTYQEYEEFLETRCLPRSRDNLKLYLRELDIPFYEPLMIIEKTNGKMADDEFWIKLER